METEKLRTDFAGVSFSNPFIVASSPLTSDASHILAAAYAGWGGAVTKTISMHPQYTRNLNPSLARISENNQVIGIGNNELLTRLTLKEWCQEEIPHIKREAPGEFVLIGSIAEGIVPLHWVQTASALESSGVDIIELNVSCPHGTPEKFMGAYINDDPDLLETIVTECTAKIKVPIIVKLNAFCRDLLGAVQACERGGAKGISATNTLLSLPVIDIDQQAPGFPVSKNGYSTVMGYSGPGIRPFGLYCVSQIAQHTALPISGVGGIGTGGNIIEYLLVGAWTVQVCTAAMLHGLSIVGELTREVIEYLNNKACLGLADIRGKALPKLVTADESLHMSPMLKACIREDACVTCGECLVSCRESATAAIRLHEDKITIDQEECNGCGLCAIVCTHAAIRLLETTK